MPIYEYLCEKCEKRQEHFLAVAERDQITRCGCGGKLFRLPGGRGLLYFEEGRPRKRDWADKPITSHAEHQRLMKLNGLVEVGDIVPPSIVKSKNGPQHPLMQEKAAGTQRGRWI